jgi:hypothetical protein
VIHASSGASGGGPGTATVREAFRALALTLGHMAARLPADRAESRTAMQALLEARSAALAEADGS